jgi:hypothetical protein
MATPTFRVLWPLQSDNLQKENKHAAETFFHIVIRSFGRMCWIASTNRDDGTRRELHNEKSLNLCNAYAHSKLEKAKAELIRRNDIPDDEWPDIEDKKIRIGMSELGLVCSWGKPSLYGTINKTVNRYGESKQWAYRPCTSCKAKYVVYTENGKITSWQN